jgi:hypothetical protein
VDVVEAEDSSEAEEEIEREDPIEEQNNPDRLDNPVGGRLSLFWEEWEKWGAEKSVIDIVREGLKIQFTQKPVLSVYPIEFPVRTPEQGRELELQVQELLKKEVIEVVENAHSPGYYSRFFLVEKREKGKWRSILDLSQLNLQIQKEKFKMESTETIRSYLKKDMWVTSIDLSDAYYHILVHPKFRKYMRFSINQNVFQYRTMVMGLTSSPRLFTKVIKCVKSIAHKFGIQLFQYLDDWMIAARSQEEARRNTEKILNITEQLGWIINMKKSELAPTQDIVFLGYHYLLGQGIVKPCEARWQKIQSCLPQMLVTECIQAKEWQKILGLLCSVEKLVPLGMLHLRPIQLGLQDQWSQHRDKQAERLWIAPEVRQEIQWWLEEENVMTGIPLQEQWDCKNQVLIFTDASLIGYGGVVDGVTWRGKWSQEEETLHINMLEMLAVFKIMKAFKDYLTNRYVMLSVDNTTVMYYLKKQGGTRSRPLNKLALEVLGWCRVNNITLRCRYIAGKLNVLADQLSRPNQILASEWSMSNRVLDRVWQIWDKPVLDLFATHLNHKMTSYVSPVPDPGALQVDAFAMSWKGLYAYAYPPTAVLKKVIGKVQEEQCMLVLVAPRWPKQLWFQGILDLLVDYPIRVPVFPKLLRQQHLGIFHDNAGLLDLHVWKISNDHYRRKVFRTELQNVWQDHRKLPRGVFIRQSGISLLLGVDRDRQIPIRQIFL